MIRIHSQQMSRGRKFCRYISHNRACATASEVINISQNRLHRSVPQHDITKSQIEYIWCTTGTTDHLKCCKNWKTDENSCLAI